MSWLYKMWAYVFIPWDWEPSLSSGISLSLSLTSMHQASADATESYIVDIKASIQTHFLCQLAECLCFSEQKVHPPSKGKKILKKFSFINIMVIPERYSMRLSLLLRFLFFGLVCLPHDSHQKQ